MMIGVYPNHHAQIIGIVNLSVFYLVVKDPTLQLNLLPALPIDCTRHQYVVFGFSSNFNVYEVIGVDVWKSMVANLSVPPLSSEIVIS
jgi:hypothetical protein